MFFTSLVRGLTRVHLRNLLCNAVSVRRNGHGGSPVPSVLTRYLHFGPFMPFGLQWIHFRPLRPHPALIRQATTESISFPTWHAWPLLARLS
jgi:hypothetical protein